MPNFMGMHEPLSGSAMFLRRVLHGAAFCRRANESICGAFIGLSSESREGTPQSAADSPDCSDRERRPIPKTQPIETMVYQTAYEQIMFPVDRVPQTIPHRGKHDCQRSWSDRSQGL